MITTECERGRKKELCVEKENVEKARAHDKSLETYQTRIVPARQGRELVVRICQFEVTLDVRGRNSILLCHSGSVVLVVEQVLCSRERVQA
jgi:hypothetical protein